MGNITSGCSSSQHCISMRVPERNRRASSIIPTIKVEECDFVAEREIVKIDKSQFRVPLDDVEIFAIVTTWTAVKANLSENGMDLFHRMFQSRSDVKSTFERFRSISDSGELWENKALQRHGAAVMSVIDDIIINLDDEKYVIDMILEQGSNHARFYGFRPQLFWAAEEPFLAIVEDSLAATMTDTLRDIYARTIHFILATLITCFEHNFSHMYSLNSPKINKNE